MSIRMAKATIPISALGAENPLPMLRSPSAQRPLVDGGLSADEKKGFGDDTGWRVLPYRMQDEYGAEVCDAELDLIVLENERLRASFLPGLGGRLNSLFDKDRGRECLFHNPVIKLSDLALRNAWFSGGIEWNYGHFGHTFFTCAPMFFGVVKDSNGVEFLRMYEFERMSGTVFQVDFHLPPGAGHLTAHMVCVNPNDEPAPLFLWTNTAVTGLNNPRVFSGTDEVIIQRMARRPEDRAFLHAKLPDPFGDGVDHSYPSALDHSEEYFFQNPPDIRHAFEVAAYDDGRLFIDRSTGNYPYRKMFCWGKHAGGRRWQEHLSLPGNGDYLEVQAGCARTQVHGRTLAPRETRSITQLFAPGFLSPDAIGGDYEQARARVSAYALDVLSAELVEREHARCVSVWDRPAEQMLHDGSGWGALENLRCPGLLPAHLRFPESLIGEEQAPWASLLRGEAFTGADSFMTTPPWRAVMERALAEGPGNDELNTHLGIACAEALDSDAARAHFEQSLAIKPTPLAHRLMACMHMRANDAEAALEHMRGAWSLLSEPSRAYAEEYLLLLTDAGLYAEAYAFYRSLPPSLQRGERMSLTAALSAFEVGDDAFLDAQYARTFSVVKEGEMRFLDTWFKREAKREAELRGVPLDDALLSAVRREKVPPKNIDFRMHREE